MWLEFQDKKETVKRLEEFANSQTPITLKREGDEAVIGRVRKGTSESPEGYAVVFQRYPHVIDEVIINVGLTRHTHNCTFIAEGKSLRRFHYKDGIYSRFEVLSKFLGPYTPTQ